MKEKTKKSLKTLALAFGIPIAATVGVMFLGRKNRKVGTFLYGSRYAG